VGGIWKAYAANFGTVWLLRFAACALHCAVGIINDKSIYELLTDTFFLTANGHILTAAAYILSAGEKSLSAVAYILSAGEKSLSAVGHILNAGTKSLTAVGHILSAGE